MKTPTLIAVWMLVGSTVLGTTHFASAAIIADYEFNGNLESSVGGVPDLIAFGSGSYGTTVIGSNTVGIRTFTASGGFDFDNTGLSTIGATHSIALLVEFDVLTAYKRIVDYQEAAYPDNGLYFHSGRLNFYNFSGDGPTAVSQDQYATVVLTSDGSIIRGFIDGTLQWTTNASGALTNATPNSLVRFFKDDTSEDSPGSVARIQIYNTALDVSEVAALDLTEPSSTIPEPSSLIIFTGLGLCAGVGGWRRKRRKAA